MGTYKNCYFILRRVCVFDLSKHEMSVTLLKIGKNLAHGELSLP